ncbi:MAG: tetratricopeptide repeat protein [Bacteroidales bacterium]|nr:tetratricopeptide repeat protein [Bacteroidales bacterium]
MKKFFAVIVAALGLAGAAWAQDFNAAVETFNAGAQTESKAEALNLFKTAYAQFVACGEEPEALAKVEELKTIIPNYAVAIAKEHVAAKDYDAAITALEEAIKTCNEFGAEEKGAEAVELEGKVYQMKANAFMKEKNFAAAIPALQEVIARNPEDGKTFTLLGQAQMQSGDLDGALASLNKAAELGEDTHKLLSNVYLKKGMGLLKAGKNAEAIEALELSNSHVESANAYKLMANAYTKSGKNKEAIDCYKKYLVLDPNAKDAADINFTIAATAQKAGDKATAKEYYGKLAGTKYASQAEAQLKTL